MAVDSSSSMVLATNTRVFSRRVVLAGLTPSCTPYNPDDTNEYSPFGFAILNPNVVAIDGSGLDLQLVDAFGSSLVGSASFSIGFQLNETELHGSNYTITVGSLASDFADTDQRSSFNFTPAKDGPGPFKIELQDLTPYILFEVTASLSNGRNFVRFPKFFVDDVALEIEPRA
ncbi:hypothetical protein F5884DRAFT_758290 [Xylogone sp. PMI_703]|nr:hypothetical protein F5884DRAFT_758290 [Xylogone sp. PMI_703]